MDKFIIEGGTPLSGSIQTDGSKNAALPILAGALLIDTGQTVITNLPPLKDILVMFDLLRSFGAKVEYDENAQKATVDASNLTSSRASYDLVSKMRGAFVALGPLLARMGEATVSLPGGCSLGARPVDYHIKGLRQLGADVSESEGYVTARRSDGGDSVVSFDRQTHTGTENLIFAATLGSGKTTIINAACDPEVIDVAKFLNSAGAKVSGAGSGQIEIEAVPKLQPIEYQVSGDRLVAGTYMFAAAATGGSVEVFGVAPDSITMVTEKLREMGCQIKTSESTIQLKAPRRLTAVSAVTCPFPGFPTDLQPCLLATMTVAEGTSRLRETIFEDRFGHAMELRRLGADITIASDECLINGVQELKGATIMAGDIRAGAGLVIGALVARKQSVIKRVYHIDRGYDRLEEKLSSLGANIVRQTD